MRRSFRTKLIYNESKFLGINLGYDYCAEHEQGLRGIEKSFGINTALIGVDRYRNFKIPDSKSAIFEVVEFVYAKTPWVALYFNSKKYFNLDKKELKKHIPRPFSSAENEIATAWDADSFSIVVRKCNKWIIDEIVNAINRNDLAIGIGSTLNPYSNGGLQLMVISYMPEEMKTGILESHKDYQKLMKAVEKTKIKNILQKAEKKYYALIPQWYTEDFKPNGRSIKTKHKVIFFLNPHEQTKYNAGWFTVEELKDWSKDKGIILKGT